MISGTFTDEGEQRLPRKIPTKERHMVHFSTEDIIARAVPIGEG